MNLQSGLALTDAILTTLTGAGLTVGDAIAPADASASVGYVVVYPLTGGGLDGPIGAPNDDAAVLYQFTSVGHDRAQCQWVSDKARTTILGTTLVVAGRTIMRVEVDMLGGVTRDDDVQSPVFYSPDRYRIWSTPT